jgi:AbrB family looped-hinge helix DNA binding protein
MMPLEYIKRKVSPADFPGIQMFMSNALVKLQRKGQMVIPRSLREEAGVAEGTLLKVAVVKGGQFLVTPQFTIDRSVIADRHKDSKQAFRELAQVVAEIRQEAKEKGIDKMPMSEINAAVAAARKALQKKTSKRRVK